MLNDASGFQKIYLATGYTDLRRGMEGLANIIRFRFHLDPYDRNTLFLFCGKRTYRIKGLLLEEDGFLLLYKRLDTGAFNWSRSKEEALAITPEQYAMLMQGLEIVARHPIEQTEETVVLLSHKKPDSYIHIDVEFGEGEGKIPVDKIVQRAEQYKPKERVTYKRIKEYILEKYGFKVHTAYIAEVKRSLGLPMYDAPNAVEKLKQARKHPTPEKVEAIKDALHYFAVI